MRKVIHQRNHQVSRPVRPYSLDWLREYLPHYLEVAEPSQFHLELETDLQTLRHHRGQKRNYRAPRGQAKTTVGTVGYVLHAAVEALEPFTLLLSESGGISEGFLRSIREELEDNPKLAAAYPHAVGVGPVWKTDHVVLRNGVCIMARGAGSRIRGVKHRQHRPSLVILDDPNEKGDAYSPTMRRRKMDWLTKDVLSVGSPRTNYLCYGTPIHNEAIVCELSRNGAWQTRQYKSVIRYPNRMDLWQEWEMLLTNLADPDRYATARAFYLSRQADMDNGAEVLWPQRESLYDLMVQKATQGEQAFGSEKQDVPGVEGATEWPPEWFDDPGIWFSDWPANLMYKVQALDPSKGANDRTGDWQAHPFGGVGPDGNIYLEIELRREPIGACVGRSLDIAERFVPTVLLAEANSTMGLLLPEFQRQMAERAAAGRPLLVNYEEFTSTDPKAARIRRIGSYLGRKQVRVRNTPGGRELVAQWRSYPNAEYDDGPDAVGVMLRRMELLASQG